MAGGHGGARRRSRAVTAIAGERDRGGDEDEGECKGGSRGWRGAAGDVQGEEEAARQGGGGRRVATRAGHVPLPTGARRKATGGEAAVGWAVLGWLVAPGKWLEELGRVGFSLSFF